MSDKAEAERVWRQGSWFDCLRTIRSLAENRTLVDTRLAIEGWFTSADLRFSRAKQRKLKLLAIAMLVFADPDGDSAEGEVARAELTSSRAQHTAQGVQMIAAAYMDSLLADDALTRAQVEAVRAITLEDVECVYDFEAMAETAKSLALILYGLAGQSGRFDDFRMAMRISSLHIDGKAGDVDGFVHLCIVMLDCALEVPVVSLAEAEERLEQIRRVYGRLEHLRGPGQDAELEASLQRAEEATLDGFELERSYQDYDAILERLESAFKATRNPAYLEDLLLYLGSAREGESSSRAARRLADLAVFHNMRGATLQRQSDFLAAAEHQAAGLELTDSSDPSRAHRERAAATFEVTLAKNSQRSAEAEPEKLLATLPPIPYDPALGVGQDLGAAYLARATIEIEAAFAEEVEVAKAEDLLADALAAATTAQALLATAPTPFARREADALVVCANAAMLAFGDAAPAEEDLRELATVLEDPRAGESSYDMAVVVGIQLALRYAAARQAFRIPLAKAHAIAEAQRVERLHQLFIICRLSILISLADHDISSGGEAAASVLRLAADIGKAAVFMARGDPLRLSSSLRLEQAAGLVREVAVQFAQNGAFETAARLTEASSSMRATDAVIAPDDSDDMPARVAVQRERGEICLGLILLVGFSEVVVLTRAPGEEWELAAHRSSAALDHFAAVDWSNPDQMESLFAFKAELTGLAHVLAGTLGDSLAALQATGDGPVLCLPTGSLAAFPLGCVHWIRPDIRPPLIVVPGSITDGVAEAVSEPFPSKPRVAVLAGARKIAGSGCIDVESEIEAIQAAGLDTIVIEAGSEEFLQPGICDALHYGGHLIPVGPDDTALVLPDGSGISLGAIREASLGHIKVVTLLACYSGFGAGRSAEQIEHAAGAFLEAGVPTAVASLWPIFDRPAYLFTQAFYTAMNTGGSVGSCFMTGVEAIRLHRVGDFAPYEHPIYWAGLTLYAGASTWWPQQGEDIATQRSNADPQPRQETPVPTSSAQ